jgi:hypothetical protein
METLLQDVASKLSLNESSSSLPSSKKLHEELSKARFSIFSDITDLGYFSWNPNGPYQKLHDVRTSGDIVKHIDYHGIPSLVEPADDLRKRCPLKFKKLKPQGKHNRYPYDKSFVAPLHVLVKTGRVESSSSLEDIDFLFGGSTLNMLATKKIGSDDEYFAQLVPGTNIVVVKKHKVYKKNLSDNGFQFERFCYGGNFSDQVGFESSHHLQVMTIGRDDAASSKVMFTAECDGMDKEGNPVEIKLMDTSSTSKCEKTSFQMISSGSVSLYAGWNNKGTLAGVNSLSLSEVVSQAVSRNEGRVKLLEENILTGIRVLREAVDAGIFKTGRIMTLSFEKGLLRINPLSLFPDDSVVKDLLEASSTNAC